eukprot:256499-Lingulodinium_polyedra.AAC.1
MCRQLDWVEQPVVWRQRPDHNWQLLRALLLVAPSRGPSVNSMDSNIGRARLFPRTLALTQQI